MRARTAILATTAAAALAASAVLPGGEAEAKKPPRLIVSYAVLGVTCEPSGENVRAVVRVRMRVVNYDGLGEWANGMEARARLVPVDSPGFSPQRNWAKATSGTLTINRTHTREFTLRTEPVRPDATWKVQIKMTWDRPAPIANVVRETTRSFDDSCTGLVIGRGGR